MKRQEWRGVTPPRPEQIPMTLMTPAMDAGQPPERMTAMHVRYETYCNGRLLKVIEQIDVSTLPDSPAERQYVDGQWTWEVDRSEVPQDIATAMLAKYGDTERPGPMQPLVIR